MGEMQVEPQPEDYSWFRFLPAADRVEFLREFAAANRAEAPERVVQVVAEWRNTAQVHAEPELLEILRSEVTEDGGAVLGPVR